jgi:hypothetical protein
LFSTGSLGRGEQANPDLNDSHAATWGSDQAFCAPAVPVGLNHINDATPSHPPDARLVHVGEQPAGYSAGATIDARRLQPTVNN